MTWPYTNNFNWFFGLVILFLLFLRRLPVNARYRPSISYICIYPILVVAANLQMWLVALVTSCQISNQLLEETLDL